MTINVLRGMEVLLAVAEAGSFTSAARKMGLSRAAVTMQVAKLEKRFGAQLLARHGRSVLPTEAGSRIIAQAAPLLEQLDELLGSLGDESQALAGTIRIGIPPVFATKFIAPAVAAFLELHPNLQISLIHDDGRNNLTGEGLDFSFRLVYALESTSETSLLLGRAPQIIVAAPGYLARHGPPATPADLAQHNCLTPDLGTPTYRWRFDGPDGEVAVHVTGSMKANMAEAVRTAALLGHGIVLQPAFLLDSFIASGELVPLLPDYRPVPLTVYAIYGAPRQRLPRHVRAFLDFVRETPIAFLRTVPPGHKLSEGAAGNKHGRRNHKGAKREGSQVYKGSSNGTG